MQARSGGRFNWDFTGTSSVTTGNTITIQVTTPTGLQTLGTTTVLINGEALLAATVTEHQGKLHLTAFETLE